MCCNYKTKNRLIQLIKELAEKAKEIGLVINENNTKFVIMSKSEERGQILQDLKIDDKIFTGHKYFYIPC